MNDTEYHITTLPIYQATTRYCEKRNYDSIKFSGIAEFKKKAVNYKRAIHVIPGCFRSKIAKKEHTPKT
jgi:hypothetical protein